MKTLKLNLGCGTKYLKDYINCDILGNVKADMKFDLNKFPYPFKDNSVDEILIDNVLEHLDSVITVMEEIHRIMKKNGTVEIYLPYAKSDAAITDPTHIHFFTEKSMNYFSEDFEYNYYSKAKFTILKVKLYSSGDTLLRKLTDLLPFKNVLKNYLFNIYTGLYFKLEAKK